MPTTTIQGHHVAFLSNCNIVLWKCDAAATVEFGDQQVRLSRKFSTSNAFSHHANAMEYDKPQFEWQQHTQIFGGLGSVNAPKTELTGVLRVSRWKCGENMAAWPISGKMGRFAKIPGAGAWIVRTTLRRKCQRLYCSLHRLCCRVVDFKWSEWRESGQDKWTSSLLLLTVYWLLFMGSHI